MAFNPRNYKAPKEDKFAFVASENGYKKPYYLGCKVGEPAIMQMESKDGDYNKMLRSNPGETKNDWFKRLGWIKEED